MLTELNNVIGALEKHRDRRLSESEAAMLAIRALQIIAAVVSALTNFRDWK
ncbi:hypothetical protein D3C87_2153850 [compost metagenome]